MSRSHVRTLTGWLGSVALFMGACAEPEPALQPCLGDAEACHVVTPATGGATSSGGGVSSGGVSSGGSAASTGGAAVITGGSVGTGGSLATTGGSTSAGGSVSTGGNVASSGGKASTGGGMGTGGGVSATGGAGATTGGASSGGVAATGGKLGSGGGAGAAGKSAMGGAVGNGGASTGGKAGTGGAGTGGTGTGGSTGGQVATGGVSTGGASSGGASGGAGAVVELAQGKPATAKSAQPNNPVASGNDGVTSTRFCAADGNGGNWWRVDLGAAYQLERVEITWEFARQYRYRIELSSDDASYTTAADLSATTVATQAQTVPISGSARYLRITATSLPASPITYMSFFELKVFGN